MKYKSIYHLNIVLSYKMSQPPLKSANYDYNYSDKFYYLTLDEWCQEAHKILAKASKWYYQPLKPGGFGYDNMIVSLGHMFDEYNKINEENFDKLNQGEVIEDITVEQLARLIHEGWTKNYLYWRDQKPWLKGHPGNYKRPSKALGDERRNKCAETDYSDLSQDEKDKDMIIAKYILQKVNKLL